MRLTQPDSATLAHIKAVALLKLSQMGVIGGPELATLATGHIDTVLDRVFQHCGVIRVRVADDQYIEIHPRGACQ